MADNNTDVSAGASNSRVSSGPNKFPTMRDVFGRPPPPKETNGDNNSRSSACKLPTLRDVFTRKEPKPNHRTWWWNEMNSLPQLESWFIFIIYMISLCFTICMMKFLFWELKGGLIRFFSYFIVFLMSRCSIIS
jgi:hypothetical protein